MNPRTGPKREPVNLLKRILFASPDLFSLILALHHKRSAVMADPIIHPMPSPPTLEKEDLGPVCRSPIRAVAADGAHLVQHHTTLRCALSPPHKRHLGPGTLGVRLREERALEGHLYWSLNRRCPLA